MNSLRTLLGVGLLVLGLFSPQAQQGPSISSPAEGSALRGQVEVRGRTAVEGYKSCRMEYTFESDKEGNWFPIGPCGEPVQEGLIGIWDTSTITDTRYRLRVVVLTQAGEELVAEVGNLRVRNYTPIETSTPLPRPTNPPLVTRSPESASTPTQAGDLFHLPGNIDLAASLTVGGVAALGFFVLLVIGLAVRALIRGR